MFGFIVAGLCLLALLSMRRHRHHYAYAHAGGCRTHYDGCSGAPLLFQGRVREVFYRLDTTPGQEKEISEALREFRNALRGLKDNMGASREEIARAVSAETFDVNAFASASAVQDEMLIHARKALQDTLRRIHDVLDSEQRAKLAELIRRGRRGWHFHGRC